MLKFFKWLAGAVVALMLLLSLAALSLMYLVDPNDYRDEISALVAEKTGRNLQLEGDLDISVFPWLGVRTQGMSFSQPAQIGGDLIQVDEAQLRVKLLPLLNKRLEVDTIILKSPKVRVVTLADGTDSFTGLASQDSAQASQESVDSSKAAVALVVQGLQLSDAHVVIEDRQAASITELKNLNLNSGNLLGKQMAELSMSGTLKGNADTRDTQFELDGMALINPETAEMTAQNLAGRVVMGAQSMSLNIETFDFNQQQQVKITKLASDVLGVFENEQPISLKVAEINANMAAQTANFSPLSLQLGPVVALIDDLRISDMADTASTSASVSVQPFDGHALLSAFGLDYQAAQSASLQAVAAKFDLDANTSRLSLQNLVLDVDTSTIRGSVSVAGFSVPKIGFDLRLNQLNLDNYLPAETVAGSDDRASDESVGASAIAVPMAVFKDLHANGRFQAGQITSAGVKLDDIDVQVASTPGQVTITPSAELYQGNLAGALSYDETTRGAQLKIRNTIDLVQLGELLSDAQVSEQLSGLGSLDLDLLVSEIDGQQRNSGTIKLFAKEGALQGIDVRAIVDGAYSQYQRLKGSEASESNDQIGQSQSSDQTEFGELLGTFNLNDSVLSNDDLELSAPLFNVRGDGSIDLNTQTLDYSLRFSFNDVSQGQGSEVFSKLQGVVVPIRLSGNLSAPSYSLDMGALYKGLLKQELNDKKAELLKEKAGIDGGGELSSKDILKQLLINKALEKDGEKDGQAQERPLTDVGNASDAEAIEPAQDTTNDQSTDAPPAEKSDEDQLKDDLKRKLLEGLFN